MALSKEYEELLKTNIEAIKRNVSGRAEILAATKTRSAEEINRIYDLGIHIIGENRVNEFAAKYPDLDKRFDMHFIGRLQKNKVKYIIGKVSLIHSLDSISLAGEIDKRAKAHGIIQDCLVEINLGEEDTKGGISLDEIDGFLDSLTQFTSIRVRGLMGVLPKGLGKEKNIYYFSKIHKKFIDICGRKVDNSNICTDILSIGMTNDYNDALDCGSTLIRIGEGIFGTRPTNDVKTNL